MDSPECWVPHFNVSNRLTVHPEQAKECRAFCRIGTYHSNESSECATARQHNRASLLPNREDTDEDTDGVRRTL